MPVNFLHAIGLDKDFISTADLLAVLHMVVGTDVSEEQLHSIAQYIIDEATNG